MQGLLYLLGTQFSGQKLQPCSKVKKFQNPFLIFELCIFTVLNKILFEKKKMK
jgi:hypothetical protein